MPVRDFGIEAIDKEYKSVIVDTSALFFDVCYKLTKEQVESYDNAKDDRKSFRKIEIPKKFLERAIDFNEIFSLFIESGGKFKILGDVFREYKFVEWRYAKKLAASLVRSRLVEEYNCSVENMKRSLASKLVDSAEELMIKSEEYIRDNPDTFEEASKLSGIDQKIIIYGMINATDTNTAILTNDIGLATDCLNLRGILQPSERCDIFTNVNSDNFRPFLQ